VTSSATQAALLFLVSSGYKACKVYSNQGKQSVDIALVRPKESGVTPQRAVAQLDLTQEATKGTKTNL
jgi:hypothetical protein